MHLHKLVDMKGGWFVGAFSPTVLYCDAAEVGVKSYVAGSREERHVHRIGTEVTLVVSGRARMNDVVLEAGDIVLIEPGQPTDFEALTEVITVVVKAPSAVGDKYLC